MPIQISTHIFKCICNSTWNLGFSSWLVFKASNLRFQFGFRVTWVLTGYGKGNEIKIFTYMTKKLYKLKI